MWGPVTVGGMLVHLGVVLTEVWGSWIPAGGLAWVGVEVGHQRGDGTSAVSQWKIFSLLIGRSVAPFVVEIRALCVAA